MNTLFAFLLFLNILLLLYYISLYFLEFYKRGFFGFSSIFLYTSAVFFFLLSFLLLLLIKYLPYETKNPWLKSKFEWFKKHTREAAAYLFFGFKRVTVTNQKYKKVFINKYIDVLLNEKQLEIFDQSLSFILATFLCISFQELFFERITSSECIEDYVCINVKLEFCNKINTIQNKEFVCFKFDSNRFIYNMAIFYSFSKLYTFGTRLVFIIFYKISKSFKLLSHILFCFLLFLIFLFFVIYIISFLSENFRTIYAGIIIKFGLKSIYNYQFYNFSLLCCTIASIIAVAIKISSNSIYIKNEMYLPLVEKLMILSKEQKENLLKICNHKSDNDWELLYKATIDGFSSKIFHKKCDHFKNTLTIVKSINGNVFGGFTTQSWTSNKFNDYKKKDKDAFIFSLENEQNKPFKIVCNPDKYAISCNKKYGPVFGCITNENSNRTESRLQLDQLQTEVPLQCESRDVSDILIDLDENNSSTKVSSCYSNQYIEDFFAIPVANKQNCS